MAQFFEDLDNAQSAGNDYNKPFFMIDTSDDKALLKWFTSQMSFLKEHNELRLNKAKNNYARYKGIQYREQVYQPRDLPEKRIRYMPQMVVPIIPDVVDEKVARLLEYKPGIQAIPQSDTQQDKVDAKIAKRFTKHIDQVEELDDKFRKGVKSSKVAGESFVLILWSKDKGQTIVKSGETVSLPDGRQVMGPMKEGDVEIKNVSCLNMLYELARTWDEVDYVFYFANDYTEKLRKEYPEKADQIHTSRVHTYYDFETMDMKSLEGKSSVVTFWHKKTKFMAEGFECLFTDQTILKKGALPYDHGQLPLERFIDVENEEELSGQSFIDKIRAMASQYNNTTNLIIKQQMMMAHPKWMVEGGAVEDQDLGNDMNIVKIKPGMKAPVLAQGNPVSPQMFEFRKELKKEFYEMAKSNSLVRGEPPPGVTAFVALQYVSESENRRISSDVASVNKTIRNIYEKILKTCGQYYKKTDKRTMLIMGKDNRWNSQFYDPSSLSKPYTLVLQNSSSLPDSKALRTQFVMDMGKNFPDQFPPEQVAEMLDLGQSEKMMDLAGLAARAAEDENEMILDGTYVPDPEIQEHLITHWRVHVSAIQDIGFKIKTHPAIKASMISHISATEMLMLQMRDKSMSFAQKLMIECPQFPLFFEPAPPPPGMPPVGIGGPSPMLPPPGMVAPGPGMDQGGPNKKKVTNTQPGDPGYSGVPPQKGQGLQIP